MRKPRIKDQVLYQDRQFINAPEYGGHAAISVSFIRENARWNYGELSISDCSRIINLDVEIDNEFDLDKTKKKIKILREFFDRLDNFIQTYEIPPEENKDEEIS